MMINSQNQPLEKVGLSTRAVETALRLVQSIAGAEAAIALEFRALRARHEHGTYANVSKSELKNDMGKIIFGDRKGRRA